MSNQNGVMMQYFHWYNTPEEQLWNQLEEEAPYLAKKGLTAFWVPPPYKGSVGQYDVGYGVYDLYDLGEFNQKGSIATKYGTREAFLKATSKCRELGIDIYIDTVLNHLMGGDLEEEVESTPFSFDNRLEVTGAYQKIKTNTHFTFPGRTGAAVGLPEGTKKYSNMEWHWWHFDAVDYDKNTGNHAVYLLKGKSFDQNVSPEKNNYDYLMGCDLDIENPEVKNELVAWGKWIIETTNAKGFRLDAVKHVSSDFFEEWLSRIEQALGKELFAVGEYWENNLRGIDHFLESTHGNVTLFDAPLHYNFHHASMSGNHYDLRTIFDGSLVQQAPTLAVTLVENHDSQPLQSLESPVAPWFKPLAYALILLRDVGYPCVFYADYYGASYTDKGDDGKNYDIVMPSFKNLLDKMLDVRQTYCFGKQYDYFDHPNTIGWTRLGTEQNPGGMALMMTNGSAGSKWMEVGYSNKVYFDITGHLKETITTNQEGWGNFKCPEGSVSVWIPV
jgi:alpha-amylase